jgi:hypothetical protein
VRPFHTTRPSATILIYAFARTAQFSLTAGNVSAFRPREIEILARRAADLARLVKAVDNVASSGFRLGAGTVLMLGIPVTQAEQISGRQGLCVIYAVYARQRRRSSAGLLINMISAFSTNLGMAISGTYMDPARTADAYTRLLQTNDDITTIELTAFVADRLSAILAAIVAGAPQRHPTHPADHYSAVCTQAARAIRTGQVQFCYYIQYSPKTLNSTQIPAPPLLPTRIRSSSFLPDGIILGHSFRRSEGLPSGI